VIIVVALAVVALAVAGALAVVASLAVAGALAVVASLARTVDVVGTGMI
jgi:hypothetical protein